VPKPTKIDPTTVSPQCFLEWEAAGKIAESFVKGKGSSIVDVRVYDNCTKNTVEDTVIFFIVLGSYNLYADFAKATKELAAKDIWGTSNRRQHRLRAFNDIWGKFSPQWDECSTYHGSPLKNSVDVLVLPPDWEHRLKELEEGMNYASPKILMLQWRNAQPLVCD